MTSNHTEDQRLDTSRTIRAPHGNKTACQIVVNRSAIENVDEQLRS